MNSVELGTLVHVIDDDPGVRRSLSMLLESASFKARAHASAEEFLGDVDLSQPACIVLDLRMPGLGGMELLQQLRRDGHEIPVIIISGHADVTTAVRGMQLGAIDLLQKPFEPATLLEAVDRAIEMSRRQTARQASQGEARARFAQLTPRELDLLKLVVAGRSNKQIASDLSISIKTVANHRASLMAKTGALNAADLSRLSTMAGLASAE
jgi:two-component system, LuxR family, response regulator FixJ